MQHPEWKKQRIIDLGSRTGCHKVYVDQIAERLGVPEHFVTRTLKKAGVPIPSRPKFNAKDWLARQYAKDQAKGKRSGKRPPSYRKLAERADRQDA